VYPRQVANRGQPTLVSIPVSVVTPEAACHWAARALEQVNNTIAQHSAMAPTKVHSKTM